jgi:hypothetical protein
LIVALFMQRSLVGTTQQANRIARAIDAGEVGVNLLGRRMFEKAWLKKGGLGEVPAAFAVDGKIYLRKDTWRVTSDAVHEGTHMLDLARGYRGTLRQWETRAYFYERQYQVWRGVEPNFSTFKQMQRHIDRHY